MHAIRTGLLSALLVALATTALAQTTLTADPGMVAPGGTVTVRVTGPAGQHFAVIGSSMNSGFTYGGVPLAVGNDVAILVQGVLDGTGQATLGVIPPFAGTSLDRYYLQAVTSTSASFLPPTPSAGLVIRNRDASSAVTGTTVAGSTSTLNGCNTVVIASTPVTITRASKVMAFGHTAYTRNTSNLRSGVLHVELRNASDTTVARSYRSLGTLSSATDNGRLPISVSQLLKVWTPTGHEPQDFVAAAGDYTLRLTMSGNDGTCAGNPVVWDTALSYLLVDPS
jgi:hypothetical protein